MGYNIVVKLSKLMNYKFKVMNIHGRECYYFLKTEKAKTRYRFSYFRNGDVSYISEYGIWGSSNRSVNRGYLSVLSNKEMLIKDITDITRERDKENIERDIIALKEVLYWMYGI